MPPEELNARLKLAPAFRGRQLFQWIHQRQTFDFQQMSNLPAELREKLAENYGSALSSEIVQSQSDSDGTVKVMIRLADGKKIESVLLNDEHGRRTACLSSQVGCALACRFCKTGTMGLLRNLSAGEIVEQYYHLSLRYGRIDNIVFMGMGEPLQNLAALRRAIEIFQNPQGLHMSPRRITVSTSGIVSGIRQLAAEGPPVRLAVSLISADPKLRRDLMPVAGLVALEELQQALLDYQRAHGKRITLEYVLFHRKNSRPADVEALVDFVRPLNVLVNLIPWNRVAELDFQEPGAREIDDFAEKLTQAGIRLSRRYRRGRGIDGACGQLAAPQ